MNEEGADLLRSRCVSTSSSSAKISQYVPDEAEASSNWDYFRLIVQRRSLRAIDVVGIGGAGRSLTAAVLASAGPGTSVVVGGGGHRCLRPPARPPDRLQDNHLEMKSKLYRMLATITILRP